MPSLAEISPGDSIGSYITEPIDAVRIRRVAALMRDPVPTHYDRDVVRELGLGDGTKLVNQGLGDAAYLLELVQRFLDGGPGLRRYDIRIFQLVYEGDQVSCSGTVAAVDRAVGTATLELEGRIDGERAMGGRAIVNLDPSGSRP
jgi:acyl dehydratase